MEREKLEKAVLQRVAGGASIEAAAKEFKVTEKLVYTWLTIAHLEKGAECMREHIFHLIGDIRKATLGQRCQNIILIMKITVEITLTDIGLIVDHTHDLLEFHHFQIDNEWHAHRSFHKG